MKLKRLDIHGFKSFYHRTTVVFDDGITAVVGPNGCGKSNIVDGLKWVMGEQGARSLRGQLMDDVVFAGSEKRGPMGLCEVRLTFLNDGSAEVPAQWRAFEELAVERRLERGKGSDYFINRQRVRLSDVQELLAGTGIGSGPGGGGQRAYAIIEQGQIGRVVSARADERRILIEEAAGITRYRTRKRVAEKKMEETAANLERLHDLIGEVDARLKVVRRQALKAERFREYRLEAEAIERRILAEDLRTARDHADALRTRAEGLADIEAERQGLLAQTEQILAAAEAEGDAAGAEARTAAETLAELERALVQAQGRQVAIEREDRALAEQGQGLAAERASSAVREAELTAEAATGARDHAEHAEAATADEAALAHQEAERADAHHGLLEARAVAERLRREAAEEARSEAQARAEVAAARSRALAQAERAAEARAERAALAETQVPVSAAQLEAEASVRESVAALAEAQSALQTAEGRERLRQAAAQAAAAREREAGERLATARGRLRSLEEIEARHEDLGESGQALLSAKLEGVVGPAAAAFTGVPADLEAAVAAALEARLKAVVVADAPAARRALDHLTARGRGRGVLALADGAAPITRKPPAHPGLEGRLADLAGLADPLATALLGEALLATDLESAMDLARQWFAPVVTRQGSRVEGSLFIVAGGQGADPGPLRRRRELASLARRVTDLEADHAAARSEAEATGFGVDEARQALTAARQGLHAAELAVSEARQAQRSAEQAAERLATEIGRLGRVAEHLADEAERAEDEAAVRAERLETLARHHTDRAGSIAEAEAKALAAEAHRDAAVEALHRARTQAVSRRERLDAMQHAQGRITRQIEELRARVARAGEASRTVADRRRALEAERESCAAQVATLGNDSARAAAALRTARASETGVAEALRAARTDAARARQAGGQAREQLNEARLALQAARLRVDHLAEAVEARGLGSVDALLADTASEPPLEAETRSRHGQLVGLLAQMGDVNPQAIEELAEIGARFEFLSTQRLDLEAALADLHAAIARIDDTSRQLFADTFAAVNAQFKLLFPRLFRGGEAELVLTEPDDLLGTGIEMLVCPPGKKVQNVALLSGGEKALCAIALIFAVFRVKPSPFCLLDEVDAPLDDANIGRFNELVREMSQMSQIVLITHNKRTMEIADILYGITMEEAGISKLVGVRMT